VKPLIAAGIILSVLIATLSAQTYILQRNSINSGGGPGTGPGYNLNGSAGQAVQGTGAGTGYLGYWGFWYGRDTIGGTPPGSDTGWARKGDVPAGPKNKNLKDGACMANLPESDGGLIYLLKGNNRLEFYKYNTHGNTWFSAESIPAVGRAGKKKAVKKGATIAYADGKFYATKGNSTLEFWQYSPAAYCSQPTATSARFRADSREPSAVSSAAYPWTQMADIPVGAKSVKEGAGATAVKVGDTTCVYFLKGSSTQEFYRYNTVANTWQRMADAPLGASGKTYKNGSCVTYDSDNLVYALKGSYNEFFAYDVNTNVWTTKSLLPMIGSSGRKKKVKDGAGIAWLNGPILALKGGNTNEFWAYDAIGDKWTQYPDVPPGGGKRVKGGGALVASCCCDGVSRVYALKGNNTLELWCYKPGADGLPQNSNRPENAVGSAECGVRSAELRISPNPFSGMTTINYSLPKAGDVSLRLYDVAGRAVSTLAEGYHNRGASSLKLQASSLASGIYLLRLVTQDSERNVAEPQLGAHVTTTKLIIE
jgi:N-acetylneuraminic acid mutarotase